MAKTPDSSKLRRAETILKVQCGLMTATEAARRLGVSRKTYYQWEKRGLAGLMAALEEGSGGRPAKARDLRLEREKKDRARLEIENSLLQKRLEIRRAMDEEPPPKQTAKGGRTAKKNSGSPH